MRKYVLGWDILATGGAGLIRQVERLHVIADVFISDEGAATEDAGHPPQVPVQEPAGVPGSRVLHLLKELEVDGGGAAGVEGLPAHLEVLAQAQLLPVQLEVVQVEVGVARGVEDLRDLPVVLAPGLPQGYGENISQQLRPGSFKFILAKSGRPNACFWLDSP